MKWCQPAQNASHFCILHFVGVGAMHQCSLHLYKKSKVWGLCILQTLETSRKQ